ncbi:MAG: ATP-binding protein [Sphingobium sp.]|uniref:ATP-binding protein n=1 Tax=Sphingobium sp. TaxID=1912891 RepID=UPI002E248A89
MAEPAPFTCLARLDCVPSLADHLRRCCAGGAVPDAALIDLELALVEAANNIVIHGYAGRDDGVIEMTVAHDEAAIMLDLWDDGARMPEGQLSACRPFSLDAESGRGIGIIQSCIDDIAYNREGDRNHLRLTKRLPARD